MFLTCTPYFKHEIRLLQQEISEQEAELAKKNPLVYLSKIFSDTSIFPLCPAPEAQVNK